jgi:ABC-type nitrate/sulfonate/bicarbonate transport system permease component
MSAMGLILPIVLLAAWQIGARAPGFPVQTIAPPGDVLQAFIASFSDGTLLRATGETFQATFSGLAIAILLGVPFGFLVGLAPRADRVTSGIVEVLRPVPAVAVLPLALLAFGFGATMEAVVVAFAAFWPVTIVARSAARAVDPMLLEVADGLEFDLRSRFVKLLLPAALRQLFVGLRLGLGVALVVAVTVEVAVNPSGLGYALVSAQAALRPDQVIAFLLWIGVVGWATNVLVVLAEHRLFQWDTVGRGQT